MIAHIPEISESLYDKVFTLRNLISNSKKCFKMLKIVQKFIEKFDFLVINMHSFS